MSGLAIYNTLTRRVEPVTRANERLTMYFCGPTVYNRAHIGNFRTYLVEDVLVRVLKLENERPYVVRNITDVDDKTIRDSQKEGLKLSGLTDKYTKLFHDDCDALNILTPDIEPRATEHIADQIQLIEALLKNGNAYQSDGSVYFRVRAFERYGELSGLKHCELQTQALDSAGKRNLADEYTRENVSDFVLWKAYKPEDGDVFWESPWGRGRPGWHIECSAMSMKYLGRTIDLHAGGVDLCFPHHENEIAQSEAATHEKFVRYWVHIAHLMVDGAKMSKSLHNMYTLQDIADAGYSPDTLRYCLLAGHYRQPLNFTMNSLVAADNALKKLRIFYEKLPNTVNNDPVEQPVHWQFFGEAYHALLDDLNIPLCLGKIFKTIGVLDLNINDTATIAREFEIIRYALGLRLNKNDDTKLDIPNDIAQLARERWDAKIRKDYKLSDHIRSQMESLGWLVKDTPEGYMVTKK